MRAARGQAREAACAAGAGPDLDQGLCLDFDATITTSRGGRWRHKSRILPAIRCCRSLECPIPWRAPGDLESREPVCHRLIAGRRASQSFPCPRSACGWTSASSFRSRAATLLKSSGFVIAAKVMTIWQGWDSVHRFCMPVLDGRSRWCADSGVARGGAFDQTEKLSGSRAHECA